MQHAQRPFALAACLSFPQTFFNMKKHLVDQTVCATTDLIFLLKSSQLDLLYLRRIKSESNFFFFELSCLMTQKEDILIGTLTLETIRESSAPISSVVLQKLKLTTYLINGLFLPMISKNAVFSLLRLCEKILFVFSPISFLLLRPDCTVCHNQT